MSIITTILDNDFYKFTMSQFLSTRDEGKQWAEYTFMNRSANKAIGVVNHFELKEEINKLLNLRLSFTEASYLNCNGISQEYLDKLINSLAKKEVECNIVCSGTEYNIFIGGPWWLATLYETPILAIVNELYNREIQKRVNRSQKWAILDNLDSSMLELTRYVDNHEMIKYPNIVEFGTRRRFSKEAQEAVVSKLKKEGIIHASSNVELCRKLGLTPRGTMAHEIPMGFVALEDEENKYNREAELIQEWASMYPDTYWLTDTFGTSDFLKRTSLTISKEQIGLRQDSGDPLKWINDLSCIYNEKPNIMFSDGLDVLKITKIHRKAREAGWSDKQIQFGWGTNLTNNGDIKPLSIVIKLAAIGEKNTCKLSDNIKKAFGGKKEIEQYKEIFNYSDTEATNEECRH